jgi:hypothetical protein
LLLACREYHDLVNHEASQNNYGACLSVAGHKAEAMCSAFADVGTLQFNSSQLIPNIIRMTSSDICQKFKTIVLLAVCVFWRSELRWLPHEDIGKPPLREPSGSRQKYVMEHNNPIVIIIIICYMI